MNNSKDDSSDNQKILNKKRKPKFSLEEILNIYCKQHNIEDNEISEKIKTIYYHNPEKNILINYNKDNGDRFPLSCHIKKKQNEDDFNLEDEDPKERGDDIKENNEFEYEQKEEEIKEINEKNENESLLDCVICGWKFLSEMSFEEKNRHINLCIEGKGEENKKELISTYKELENFKNADNAENNQENNEERDNNQGDNQHDE